MWTSMMTFYTEQQRRPSKYRPEEHDLLNWMKYNVRRFRSGNMPLSRQQRMQQLISENDRLRRVNQYTQPAPPTDNHDTP